MSRTARRDLPIVPFKTFITSLDELAQSYPALPNRLDRSLFDTFSGALYKLIANSYRLFDLVDENRRLKGSRLEQLLDGRTRRSALRQLLHERFPDLLDLPTSAVTERRLNEWFARNGLDEVSTRKARAFFIQACAAADIALPAAKRDSVTLQNKPLRKKPRIKNAPGTLGLPEPLIPWLQQLPKAEQKWSGDELDRWLSAFAGMLRYLYLNTSKDNT